MTPVTATVNAVEAASAVEARIIITSAQSLTAALKASVKPDKNVRIPVLAYARMTGSTLGVTDLDNYTTVQYDSEPANDSDSGTDADFLIPYHQTLGVLAGEKGKLVIQYRPSTSVVVLAINGCEYTFPTLPVANYPAMPVIESDPDKGTVIEGAAFGQMLTRTRFAVSKEESRYTLNGVLLESGKGTATMVATDGHRLSIAEAEAHGADLKALVKLDTINWLYANSGDHVVISSDENYVRFDLGDRQITSRKLTGQFPNYHAVMPRDNGLQVQLPNAETLAKTLARVAKCADERGGATSWVFGPECTVMASSTSAGTARAKLDGVVLADTRQGKTVTDDDGNETVIEPEPSVSIGFNAAYVAEYLKLAGKEPVTVALRDSQSAALFTSGDSGAWKYVVMPMRI